MGLIRDVIKGGMGQSQNSYGGQQPWSQEQNRSCDSNQHSQQNRYSQFSEPEYRVPRSSDDSSPDPTAFYQSNVYRQAPVPSRNIPPLSRHTSKDGAPTTSLQDSGADCSQDDRYYYEQTYGSRSHNQIPGPPAFPQYSSRPIYQQSREENIPMSSGPLSRPFAIPQTGAATSAPFLRGFSNDLADAGVEEGAFFRFLDALNLSIVPNPEMQLANTAAGLAGWFIPGLAAGIALAGVQVVAQVGGSVQVKGATKMCLQNANQNVFGPCGLEVQLQSTLQLNNLLGLNNHPTTFSLDPAIRLQMYQSYISPLSVVLSPVQGAGRQDPLAGLASSMSNRKQAKQQRKAQEDAMKAKMRKATKLENGFLWLVVNNLASPGVSQDM